MLFFKWYNNVLYIKNYTSSLTYQLDQNGSPQIQNHPKPTPISSGGSALILNKSQISDSEKTGFKNLSYFYSYHNDLFGSDLKKKWLEC